MRDWLEWRRREFVEYDVEADPQARQRIRDLVGSKCSVPVLVEDGKILQVGWQGHGAAWSTWSRGMPSARSIRVRGIVQGVGFRPFVYRLANANTLTGWVSNGEDGVEIHLEGSEQGLEAFLRDLRAKPPTAARITTIEVQPTPAAGFDEFTIRESHRQHRPTVRVSADLPVCEECLEELFHPGDRRYEYPYINCTNCGPRYTVITGLPYDRPNTTMQAWPLCPYCNAEYHDPVNRRFHAQPVACPTCGPSYFLREEGSGSSKSDDALAESVRLLSEGKIVAIKGLGGYHLACCARNEPAIAALRARKFRKEKPFA
jgi:hydrogenase maturation protein HypF